MNLLIGSPQSARNRLSSQLIAALAGIVLWTGVSVSCFAQPVNDNFTSRIFLTGYTNVLTISTAGATAERGEPNPNSTWIHPSIWYSWTAPETGTATVYYTGDAYVRYFAVFTGTRLTSLRKVGRPDQRVTFETKPGQVFQIQAMAPTSTPAYAMHLELIPRPQNDNYTNRFHLTGILVSTNGSTQAATREVGERRHNQLRFGRSVWYSWTAPATGWLFLNLTNYQTLVCEPYIGSSLMRLRPVTGVLLSEEPYSGVLSVTAGVEYELAVDGKLYYDKVVHAGPFNLNLEFTGLTLLTPADTSVFSRPSQIGLAATNTLPDIDGAVYELTFCALNVLTQQEMPLGTSAGPQFELVWSDPPNGYWQLQARGVSSQNRVVQSNPAIIAIRPINDSFANSIAVEGSSATWTVDFAAATRASNDPHVARQLNDDFDGNTLWWTWTAPADGTVSLHCDNWTIGFGVYTGHPGSFGMVMMPSWASGQFRAREGHTYQILLSDRYPATAPSHGTMSLNLQP